MNLKTWSVEQKTTYELQKNKQKLYVLHEICCIYIVFSSIFFGHSFFLLSGMRATLYFKSKLNPHQTWVLLFTSKCDLCHAFQCMFIIYNTFLLLFFISNSSVKLLLNPNEDKIQLSSSLVTVICVVLSFRIIWLSSLTSLQVSYAWKAARRKRHSFTDCHCCSCNNDIFWENVMQIALNNISAGIFEQVIFTPALHYI